MIHHRHHAQTLPTGQIRMPGKLLESIGGSVLESAEGLFGNPKESSIV
jgi:hypothetical protein